MANLAIQGHPTRGSEVIEILGILGGSNAFGHIGNNPRAIYHIDENYKNFIICSETKKVCDCIIFTLEEFLEKFPYKVGDKVTLDKFPCTIKGMSWDCDDVIYYVQGVDFSKGVYSKDKDLQPYKEETMENKSNLLHQLKEYFESTPREVVEKEWHKYDKYNEISPKVNEYLEYVNNIRQPKYPKTFIEVLNFWHPDRQLEDDYQRCYKKDLVEKLQDLLYARYAYWKIAGEQMGLGKPWEPDWLNAEQDKYVLFTHNNAICSNRYVLGHNILAFPTFETRDAFYENFRGLIENCKELL